MLINNGVNDDALVPRSISDGAGILLNFTVLYDRAREKYSGISASGQKTEHNGFAQNGQ
jgi:hypothetical protein